MSNNDGYATPGCFCPRCGYYTDRASNLFNGRNPVPDDLTVCLNCAALNKFDATLRLVDTTEADWAALTMRQQALVRISQGYIKQRGPLNKDQKPS